MASVLRAVRETRYGSVEIVIHAGRVVQIERREKVRFDEGDRRPSDHRGQNRHNHDRTDRSSGGFEKEEETRK